jgi:hypothetical protein
VNRSWLLLLGGAAVAAVAVSFWTADEGTALDAAVAALLLAGLLLLVAASGRVRWGWTAPAVYDADPLVILGKAFTGGRFGRATILATLDGLEPSAGVDLAQRQLEEERALRSTEREFLAYVEARIGDLERRT